MFDLKLFSKTDKELERLLATKSIMKITSYNLSRKYTSRQHSNRQPPFRELEPDVSKDNVSNDV